MTVSADVVDALRNFKRIRFEMSTQAGLREGKALVTEIQKACPFPLCYVQRLGSCPELIIWRFTTREEAMQGHEVTRHHC